MIPQSIIETGDGGYLIAGYVSYNGSCQDAFLIKTNGKGLVQWNYTYPSPYAQPAASWANSVTMADDGGYVVAGFTYSTNNSYQFSYIFKVSPNGTMEWNHTYASYSFYSIVNSGDDGYVLTGYLNPNSYGSPVSLVKVDASGNVVWTNGPLYCLGSSVIKVPDGYVVAGWNGSSGMGENAYLAKTDNSGNLVWNRSFGGPYDDHGYTVIRSSDGGYLLLGDKTAAIDHGSYTDHVPDYYLVKTDANGNELWEKTYGGVLQEYGTSLVQTADGGYFLAGRMSNSTGSYVCLIKTDASGTVQWYDNYTGGLSNQGNGPGYVVRSSDGSYVVASDAGAYPYLTNVSLVDLDLHDWTVNSSVVSSTVPGTMAAGQSYAVSVTINNTGSLRWSSGDGFFLGAVGTSSGDAALFGPQRIDLPPNTTVLPGAQYTFNFTLTAPSANTYHPAWRMAWDGHDGFGEMLSRTVNVQPLAPDAVIVSYTIQGSMVSGASYPVSVTVRNTGNKPWSGGDGFALGALYDSAGAAAKFGPTRFSLPAGVTVNPGDSYTFSFTLTAPSAGTYYPAWRMVWEGHQWFGQTLCITVNVAAATVPDAQITGYSIPGSMTAGQTYACNVTLKNTGTKAWTQADLIGLGAMYDAAGAAGHFGPTRFYVPAGVTVSPGQSYTFSFTLTAPSAGTYYPAWQMVWDGHQWFGQVLCITVNVAAGTQTPDAQITGYSIPGTMISGHTYTCSVAVKNTGTKIWNASDAIGLGALYDSAGAAGQFGAIRFYLPIGTTVAPGSSYTFNFNLTAPSAGTYYPAWRMVWEGHQWFGQLLCVTETVN